LAVKAETASKLNAMIFSEDIKQGLVMRFELA